MLAERGALKQIGRFLEVERRMLNFQRCLLVPFRSGARCAAPRRKFGQGQVFGQELSVAMKPLQTGVGEEADSFIGFGLFLSVACRVVDASKVVPGCPPL